jgi:hypothetical protein
MWLAIDIVADVPVPTSVRYKHFPKCEASFLMYVFAMPFVEFYYICPAHAQYILTITWFL